MGFIDIITKLFGNKSQKDMQAVMPYVEKIKAIYAEIDALTDDELRARSAALMQRLQDAVAADKEISMWMGDDIGPRKDYINRNANFNRVDNFEKNNKEEE